MLVHAAALLWMAATPAAPAAAAPATPPADDLLRLYAETRRFRSGLPVAPKVARDGSAAFFLRSGPRSAVQSLFMTDLATGQTREVLSPETLLAGAQEQLTAAERARLERQRISARGFTSFALSRDGQKLLVTLGGRLYLVTRPQMKVTPLRTGETPIDPQFSPDGTQVAYVRSNDVYAVDLASNRERQLTRGGTDLVSHGLAEFVAQEEMGRFSGFWWSPDGKQLAFQESDARPLEPFTIVDPMHPEKAGDVFPYPRTGKANAVVRLAVTSTSGAGKPTWIQWDAAKYPYLATVRWSEGAPLTLLVMNRLQNESMLLRADPSTGKTTPLLTERSGHWLNLNQSFPIWKKDGSGFFWMTERNGGPEVELRDAKGALSASWVPPSLRMDSDHDVPVRYDAASDALYFTTAPDPTRRQPYRVVKGGAPEALQVGDPQPAMVEVSLEPGSGMLIVKSRTLRSLTSLRVHRASDLQKVADLPSVAITPAVIPTTEIRAVGAEPRLWTSITRPRAFKAGKKWPVLVQVYGGPTNQLVIHALDPLRQWYADQGFIVVSIDNRGTPSRGSEWERPIHRDFSQVIVADQVAGLKALAAEVPELDLDRVGVHGWSFGGYVSALAVMARPDAFKAGVAGAPVVDWRDYDTFYTERYLGLPDENREGYDRSSLLTWAPKLERPLLIVHGTADDNVYFFHALKLSDALFRAGRAHRFLPLSGFTHQVPDPLVAERLHQALVEFFRQTL